MKKAIEIIFNELMTGYYVHVDIVGLKMNYPATTYREALEIQRELKLDMEDQTI